MATDAMAQANSPNELLVRSTSAQVAVDIFSVYLPEKCGVPRPPPSLAFASGFGLCVGPMQFYVCGARVSRLRSLAWCMRGAPPYSSGHQMKANATAILLLNLCVFKCVCLLRSAYTHTGQFRSSQHSAAATAPKLRQVVQVGWRTADGPKQRRALCGVCACVCV